jgi:hypothetical protein
MVLPLLYGLGAKDVFEPLGFVVATCQKCGTLGAFAVYHAKRKVTIYSVPTVALREQLVVECRACTQRFGVPPEMHADFRDILLDEAGLAERLRAIGRGAPAEAAVRSGPTLYQILQVDPGADPDVIDAAFRRLAIKYHPDTSKDPQASEKMRQLLEAKAVLADPAKRRAYNRIIGVPDQRPPAMRPEDV